MRQTAYSLAQLRERWQCSHSHCLNLIHGGDLPAINIGTAGRSRYVVTAESVEDFEAARTVRPPEKQEKRRRSQKSADVIEFFK